MNTYRQPFTGEYPITQNYGEKSTSNFHTGIDYGCPIGTPIRASSDGVIRYNGMDKSGYGNCVIIEHDATHSTLYAHLRNAAFFIPGVVVKQGDVIGWSGNTGNSTGPHLHFEARRIWNDFRTHFDPMQLPLMSVDDGVSYSGEAVKPDVPAVSSELDPGPVMIVAPYGAYAHNEIFTAKQVLPFGTKLNFTGNTVEKDNYTFCECTVWIAVNDGETQILRSDN